MVENYLEELADKYQTDKKFNSYGHGYTVTYDHLLKDKKETVSNVLEIGIASGASIRMWKDYFTNATIHGIDNNGSYLMKEDRVKSYLVDQSKLEELGMFADTVGIKFDLIVDDGSHILRDQLLSFDYLYPLLTEDGIYAIEDVLDSDINEMKKALQGKDFRVFPSVIYNYKTDFAGDNYNLVIIIRGDYELVV